MNPYSSKLVAKSYVSIFNEIPEIEIGFLAKYVKHEDTILEIGIGSGAFLYKVNQLGYRNIAGIDISGYLIRNIKKKLSGINVVIKKKDLEKIYVNRNSYNCVIAFHFLTALQKMELNSTVMNNIKSLVGNNGILMVKSFVDKETKEITVNKNGVFVKILVPEERWLERGIQEYGFRTIEKRIVYEKDNQVMYLILKSI